MLQYIYILMLNALILNALARLVVAQRQFCNSKYNLITGYICKIFVPHVLLCFKPTKILNLADLPRGFASQWQKFFRFTTYVPLSHVV